MAAKAVHVDLELWCWGSPLTQGVPLKGPLKGFLQGIYKGFYGVSLFFKVQGPFLCTAGLPDSGFYV